jgi:hypothetical protein
VNSFITPDDAAIDAWLAVLREAWVKAEQAPATSLQQAFEAWAAVIDGADAGGDQP